MMTRTVGSGKQARALAWLEEGVAATALDELAGSFARADERCGLHVSGPA